MKHINIDDYRDRQPVPHQINPWSLAFVLSGWIWAGIWFVKWVMA